MMIQLPKLAVPYIYKGYCTGVVDGDTVDVIPTLVDMSIDVGFRIVLHVHEEQEMRLRLYGINTPERGQHGYQEAKFALRAMLFPIPAVSASLTIQTFKPEHPFEKYGRWLASIATPDYPSVADELIRLGFGVEYYGGTK
jgi:micrococcal nuclease